MAERKFGDSAVNDRLLLVESPGLRQGEPRREAADRAHRGAVAVHLCGLQPLRKLDGVGVIGTPATASTSTATSSPPIGQDPVLRHVKLIAEPWDASMTATRSAASRRRGASGTTSTATLPRDFWRGRGRRHPRPRLPAVRLLRPVRRRRPAAVRLGQLRHRARRVHAARPGVVQPQAQRGQRRGQPRRHRPQPVLEPRRSRARPTTPKYSPCRSRPRTCSSRCACRRASR